MKTFNLTEEQKEFFFQEIKKIIYTPNFIILKQFRHHGSISTYTHAIKVAYFSYRFSIHHKNKVNKRELIKAALLHDLYLYDCNSPL